MEEKLKELREKIDSVDKRLLELIFERSALVKDIAEIKAIKGVDILRPGREINLLNKLFKEGNDLLTGDSILNIWRETGIKGEKIEEKWIENNFVVDVKMLKKSLGKGDES